MSAKYLRMRKKGDEKSTLMWCPSESHADREILKNFGQDTEKEVITNNLFAITLNGEQIGYAEIFG